MLFSVVQCLTTHPELPPGISVTLYHNAYVTSEGYLGFRHIKESCNCFCPVFLNTYWTVINFMLIFALVRVYTQQFNSNPEFMMKNIFTAYRGNRTPERSMVTTLGKTFSIEPVTQTSIQLAVNSLN